MDQSGMVAMMSDNTTENVFRFTQLRPARAVSDGEPDGYTLNDRTPLARQLMSAERSERAKVADTFLRKSNLSELTESELAQRILMTVKDVRANGGSVQDLVNKVGSNKTELGRIRDSASDVLLATKFANRAPARYNLVESLFRASIAILNPNTSIRIEKYYTRAITLPDSLPCPCNTPLRNQSIKDTQQPQPQPKPQPQVSAEQIRETVTELMSLARPNLLRLPSEGDQKDTGIMLSLNEQGMKLLSKDAKIVLDRLRLQPDKYPFHVTVGELESEMARRAKRTAQFTSVQSIPTDVLEERPYIKAVGVAELLVVKQHLKEYQRLDIAHIENILAGEKKSRTHRALERSEETFTFEREITEERQTELETAERFELNKETSRTVKRDQEFGFGLTLSGKYGPTVEFSSNLTASSSSSTEESTKSAMRYSKDIVERSLERVVERVRTEQVRRLIREREETNLHELTNTNGDHISGVYQFLEKVYTSQIFDYGIRQMFDFMVPEPASYIWHLEKTETNLNLPPPPPSLDKEVPTAASITEDKYLELAAMFGITGVEQPPPTFVTTTSSILNGATGDEGGQPRSLIEKEITIPAGYKPLYVMFRAFALTDDKLSIVIGVGSERKEWTPTTYQIIDPSTSPDHKIAYTKEEKELIVFPLGNGYDSQSKLQLSALAYETNTYNIQAEVVFRRMDEIALRAWQIRMYDKLLTAHQESVQKYEARIAELKAEAEAKARDTSAKFGAPPSQNVKTVKSELKKHCISIVTRQRYEESNGMKDDNPPYPPYFDFVEAAERGSYARFFEQAFEWDQMQYVFYPYFWSRRDKWVPMFMRSETDTQFLEFLQAGLARVVVPVRPGFERAISHYLECGVIWEGNDEPPPINSPLYVPIITEIEERTGAPQGEIPVGDPWETHVPTPLVILRGREEGLPCWERANQSNWDWKEVACD